jgi:hypothetical protein
MAPVTKHVTPYWNHMMPVWMHGDKWLSQIVAAIETGDPAREAEFQTHTYPIHENYMWNKLLTDELYVNTLVYN